MVTKRPLPRQRALQNQQHLLSSKHRLQLNSQSLKNQHPNLSNLQDTERNADQTLMEMSPLLLNPALPRKSLLRQLQVVDLAIKLHRLLRRLHLPQLNKLLNQPLNLKRLLHPLPNNLLDTNGVEKDLYNH